MRIVCPQSTLEIVGNATTPAQAAGHPLQSHRAAPLPPIREEGGAVPIYYQTRARTNLKTNVPPQVGHRRIPRVTNSARNVLNHNALNRETSSRRLRPRNRDAKLDKVDAAAHNPRRKVDHVKKAKDKERRRKAAMLTKEYNYVYVGNLPTSITEARIQEFFTLNGLYDLDGLPSIRTTGGTVGAIVIPTELRTERDRRYACVRFKSNESVYRALKLHGTVFEGMELVITIDPTNLPECQQIMISHLQEIETLAKIKGILPCSNNANTIARPLQPNDTVRSISNFIEQNAAGRFKVFGVSFAPCVS